jgi:hypothetical protein
MNGNKRMLYPPALGVMPHTLSTRAGLEVDFVVQLQPQTLLEPNVLTHARAS